jgi:hypothetical protein
MNCQALASPPAGDAAREVTGVDGGTWDTHSVAT